MRRLESRTPVPRPAPTVSHGNDFNFIAVEDVDEAERISGEKDGRIFLAPLFKESDLSTRFVLELPSTPRCRTDRSFSASGG
jgi:hypothetical protein